MSYARQRYSRKSHRQPQHYRPYESRSSHRHSNHRYGRQNYSKYHYPQPSHKQVYVEEPQTESESSESEYDGYAQSDEEVYDFDLQSNDSDEYPQEYSEELDFDSDDDREEVFIIADDSNDFIDLNDALEMDAINSMEAEGKVRDVNDDLVRFYDSESGSESGSESSSESESSESESDSDSELDSDIDMDSDEEIILLLDSDLENNSESESETDLDVENDDERQLEHVRRSFAEELESEDEVSDVSTEAESDDEIFFEVDSEYDSSDEEVEVDAGDPVYYDYCMDDSSDSSDSDGEGVTIYKHRFDLPERFDSENDSTDEELDYSDEELMLRANDSDDEFEIVDLSRDLKDSKDCELVELDDNTYKLNLRLPAMIKEDLKVNFLKNENELVISGKFDFTAEDSDIELESDDDEYKSAEETKEEAESSESESSDSESSESETEETEAAEESEKVEAEQNESAESDSSESSESESSESEASESEASESDSDEEEIAEDAQQLIQDFQRQEIQFEKHFQFDKIIKFHEIRATFLANGELELIIPNEGVALEKDDNTVAITIEDAEENSEKPVVLGDDEDFSPVVEFVRQDEEMEE